MVLVNAPVPTPDPAYRAVRMATEMQEAVQELILGWRANGYTIGFGVGLAFGLATVGRIDTGSRLDYTAIGNVVNLASRLCSSAEDGQILSDRAVADAVRHRIALTVLAARSLKGYDDQVPVYAVEWRTHRQAQRALTDSSVSPFGAYPSACSDRFN
jgi:class 3 adenylate cyclase